MDNQKEPPLILRYGRNALIAVILVLAYAYSFQATEIDLPRLFTDAGKAMPIIADFITPDLIARGDQTLGYTLDYPVPCGVAPPAEISESGPRIVPVELCAAPGDIVTIEGFELRPNTEVQLRWLLPGDRRLRSERAKTDAAGSFSVEVEIRPLLEATEGQVTRMEVELQWQDDSLAPSETVKITLAKIVETLFMALMATTFACVIALPISFFGARNIMSQVWLGTIVYYFFRTIFNLMRSIEALVLAVMFAIWLGFGPFAGVMAMTIVTIASLSKLFSEAIESIDQGPIEAVVAAGGNRMQAIFYAVIPQIMPPFIAFAIYHWDINVRISTIIGFVGGGGIGLQLQTWINQLAYNKAGTAVWAIVIVVVVLDNISSQVRKRMV